MLLFFLCVEQHGSGSYGEAYFLDSSIRQLFKLVGHVFGKSSNGAEMPGAAESEKVQRVSPRDSLVICISRCRSRLFNPPLCPGRLS